MVLHERQVGGSSPVAGYVMQLPESFQTPLHWTGEERSQLQYPHLESEVSYLSINEHIDVRMRIQFWDLPKEASMPRKKGLRGYEGKKYVPLPSKSSRDARCQGELRIS